MRSSARSAIPGLNAISERLPPSRLDLEQVAGAVILDRDHGADGRPLPVHRRQADQVGVIIFARLERRQGRAVHFDERAAQGLGGGAVVDPLEPGDGRLAVTDGKQAADRAADVELLLPRQAVDAVAEQLEAQLAFDAVRPGNRGERDRASQFLPIAWRWGGGPSNADWMVEG